MTNTFSTTQLAGHRTLVTGKDDANENRRVILDSSEWDGLRLDKDAEKAQAEFDKAVAEFHAPLTKAAEKFEKAQLPALDPAFTHVVTEAVEGKMGQQERIITLDHDTVVLRLLESGNTSRLIWVGDTIEVLAPPAKATVVDVAEVTSALTGEPGTQV